MCGNRKRLKIGIAYSGGISKCAYQVGFTKTLLKYLSPDEIKVVSGSSMGLFTAYAVSAGKLARLEWMYRNINIEKPWELFWQMFVKKLFALSLDEFISLGDKLSIPVCFPVCYVPLFSTRYYWLNGEYNPIWKKYIKAATNFPMLRIIPVVQRGKFALDGGAVDNIPIYPLVRHAHVFSGGEKLDLIIALHFDAHYDCRKDFVGDVPILDIDVSICNSFKKNHFDFSANYVEEMIESSQAYAENICSALFAGDCSREGLKKKIDEIFLREHEKRQQNSSADRLISILNVVGKTLRLNADCYKKVF